MASWRWRGPAAGARSGGLLELGVPRDTDFYLCGPSGFLRELTGPEPLDDPAPGRVLLCCARPREPVTVDL